MRSVELNFKIGDTLIAHKDQTGAVIDHFKLNNDEPQEYVGGAVPYLVFENPSVFKHACGESMYRHIVEHLQDEMTLGGDAHMRANVSLKLHAENVGC